MHKTDSEFDELDALMNNHPISHVPEGFPGHVMQRIDMQAPWTMLWDRPWVQWAVAGIGLAFTLGRVLSYIFSAWLAVELAG